MKATSTPTVWRRWSWSLKQIRKEFYIPGSSKWSSQKRSSNYAAGWGWSSIPKWAKFKDFCWQVLGLDATRDGGWEVHTGHGTVTTNRCNCDAVVQCGAVGGAVVTTNRCRLRFNGVPITGLLVDRRLCKANFPLKWNKNTLITLLTPTRRIYVKCIAATFSKTFYQLKIKSWSEWSTLVASGVARLGNSPGLTFPLSRSSTRCNPINQLDICLIRFSFSYFCNVVASVPCDEVGASGAGAKKGDSSSATSRWIVLPQVSCSKLYWLLFPQTLN